MSEDVVSFVKKASVVKYLVAKEYPEQSDKVTSFNIDEDAITGMGIKIFFASCIKTGIHQYETLKKSRVVAFSAVSDGIEAALSMINKAIDTHVAASTKGALEYRRDIGSQKSLDKLQRINANLKQC